MTKGWVQVPYWKRAFVDKSGQTRTFRQPRPHLQPPTAVRPYNILTK